MATDETRPRIIEAAGPIFAERGFEKATVREICDAAGVGVASINYHFRDKQHLYVLVVEHAYEHLHCSRLPRLDDVPEGPPIERLREWILRLTRKVITARDESWQDRLFAREVQSPTAACEDFLRERIRSDLKPLREVLDAVLPPQTTEADRWRVVHSVLGQVLFYDTYRRFIRIIQNDGDAPLTLDAEQLADHVTRFCTAALGMAPPLSETYVGKTND